METKFLLVEGQLSSKHQTNSRFPSNNGAKFTCSHTETSPILPVTTNQQGQTKPVSTQQEPKIQILF